MTPRGTLVTQQHTHGLFKKKRNLCFRLQVSYELTNHTYQLLFGIFIVSVSCLLYRAGIKGLFVLMPILGVGWILGLFSLNESTIVFEYAFAIVNGFQVNFLIFK